MKKKILIISSILLVIILFIILFLNIDFYSLLEIQGEVGPFAHKIMDKIDQSVDAEGKCIIDIKELTDFNWDMMVVTEYNFPLDEIKEIPQEINYAKTKGVKSRLTFFKDNKVVYEETYRVSIETSYKFNLFFEYGGQGYKIFTPDNAQIPGHRFVNPRYSENDTNAPRHYSLVF